ncbi:MAG: diaminopimelate decarboxylase [Rhodospirillaceae bacterium]|jgi:diaminopimelate decarboxylase|nr:diaminopimelate decarboxylase [Rhodospirillaceae bacterium]MBT5565293.1 diaminopimelate decarboxylase [Rhodospirillaceae bacterium]MBT6089120.1 diaminopimelate decarboxylase [Rhodospirillaceae bacterium]
MHHFQYRDGVLHAEDVSIPSIAEAVGTPFYCYSTATLTRHYRVFTDALEGLDTLVCFSAKANGNLAVLRLLGDLGAGCDVVSGGELKRALAAGIRAEKIVFSGVGKTTEELTLALENGVGQINVESEPELNRLNGIATELGKTAPIALRVNPDVDAATHDKISTGRKEDKFGVAWDDAPRLYATAESMPGIEVRGVAVHIGSQITDLAPFETAFTKVAGLVGDLRETGIDIRTVDLGGGLGVPYKRDNAAPPSPAEYGDVVRRTVGDLGCKILLEPGRVIAANAGVLVTKVIYVKPGETKEFVIVDAAMNDLIRPAMYDAHHDVLPVSEPDAGAPKKKMDIVGPVCETGDRFTRDAIMCALNEEDLIAFSTAGAYGAVMASTYNARPLVPEVMVNGESFAVIRKRPAVEDLWALESLPDWMADDTQG